MVNNTQPKNLDRASFRIGIDCRLAGRRHAGIGRYIENLVTRLPAAYSNIHWIFFFFDTEQATEILPQPSNNVEIVYAPIRHYTITEQLRMPQIFAAHRLDLLHVPHFNIPLLFNQPFVVTIHDLLWHEYQGMRVTTLPFWQYHVKRWAYRFVVSQAISRARMIFVPADTIRKTITQFYKAADQKIIVTKEGVNQNMFNTLTLPVSKKRKKQFIYVGSLYPHKNLKLVIDALQKLPDFELLVVGTRTVFLDRTKAYVSEKGLVNRVKFLGYVSDDHLRQLYQESFALVQPSFSEGFGLTGVEAFAAGIPVLASDISTFKEIYQEAAVYFDPQSIDSFCQAVTKLQTNDQQTLLKKGQLLAKTYRWETMVEQTVNGYLHVLDKES